MNIIELEAEPLRGNRYAKKDVVLIDDGSLDTVFKVNGHTHRFSDTSDYRDSDGVLNIDAFLDDYWPEIADMEYELGMPSAEIEYA